MMRKIRLLVPEAPEGVAEPVAAASRRPLAGKPRLGILDNSKANADHLLRLLAGDLQAADRIASVVAVRKGSVAIPATPDMLDRLTAGADLVVSAMAD